MSQLHGRCSTRSPRHRAASRAESLARAARACHGKDRARDFYQHLTANFQTESEDVLHRYESDDAIVLEQMMTGTVIGSMLGRPGHGRRINFRVLHIFEFKGGLISRENVWLDTAAIIDQLS